MNHPKMAKPINPTPSRKDPGVMQRSAIPSGCVELTTLLVVMWGVPSKFQTLTHVQEQRPREAAGPAWATQSLSLWNKKGRHKIVFSPKKNVFTHKVCLSQDHQSIFFLLALPTSMGKVLSITILELNSKLRRVCLLKRNWLKMKRKQLCHLWVLSWSIATEGTSSELGLRVVLGFWTNVPNQESLSRLDPDSVSVSSLWSCHLTPMLSPGGIILPGFWLRASEPQALTF